MTYHTKANSTEQSTSLEAGSRSESQGIPGSYRILKFITEITRFLHLTISNAPESNQSPHFLLF